MHGNQGHGGYSISASQGRLKVLLRPYVCPGLWLLCFRSSPTVPLLGLLSPGWPQRSPHGPCSTVSPLLALYSCNAIDITAFRRACQYRVMGWWVIYARLFPHSFRRTKPICVCDCIPSVWAGSWHTGVCYEGTNE